MDSLDEDMFSLSDREEASPPAQSNPVEEYLLQQYSNIQDRIKRTMGNIEELESVEPKILSKLFSKIVSGESDSSESDNDMYGPSLNYIIAEKESKWRFKDQPLVVTDTWQRIVRDKWLIGVTLRNMSNHMLHDPTFYALVKNEEELRGTSSFWVLLDDTFWVRTNRIEAQPKKTMATVLLDRPRFDGQLTAEACGTISYTHNARQFETVVPTVRLTANEILGGSHALKFSADPEFSVLAMKVACAERTFRIPIISNSGRGGRILSFLSQNNFEEVCADIYISKRTADCERILVEILPMVENNANLLVSARSLAQLNMILMLLRKEFPDADCIEERDTCQEAAIALERELQLRVTSANVFEIQRAKIKTDLLIA